MLNVQVQVNKHFCGVVTVKNKLHVTKAAARMSPHANRGSLLIISR